MTNQRKAFEKWAKQNGVNAREVTTDDAYLSNSSYVAWAAWQAVQADQAEYIAMLELNNKFKDDRIKQLEIQNALYADDELILLADRDMFKNEIEQLQLDNEKLKKALARIVKISDRQHDAWDIAKDLLSTASQSESQPESVVKESLTVQKPIGEINSNGMAWFYSKELAPKYGDKLYTHPVVLNNQTVAELNNEYLQDTYVEGISKKPLSDEEIANMAVASDTYFDFARAIEKRIRTGE